MEIVYAAYTETGTFMLDERGVCRWAVAPPGKTHATVPERIVGAQYVATLDVETKGGLVDLPRLGCPMLFASVDENGRIQLVRTQPVTRFEDRRNPDASARSSSIPPALHDEARTPSLPPSSRPSQSVPPLPLVRPASPVPPRQSMVAPKMPPAPRPPSAAIPTPSAMRPVPMVSAPPRRPAATIPPPPATDPSPPPAVESNRFSTNGLPSASQSMPTRLKGTNAPLRRLVRGR